MGDFNFVTPARGFKVCLFDLDKDEDISVDIYDDYDEARDNAVFAVKKNNRLEAKVTWKGDPGTLKVCYDDDYECIVIQFWNFEV